MKINEAIIVEGQYDKITLSAIVDAVIVPVHGFSIFTDYDLLRYIQLLANKTGIIILTDSDRAGFLIRNYIKGAVNKGKILNAFIPDISGKEKRKKKSSKEGFLGVEGISREVIINSLLAAGCTVDGKKSDNFKFVTPFDFYCDGVTGGRNSSFVRKCIAKEMGLPARISSKELLNAINLFLDYEKYKELVKYAQKML